MEWLDNLKEEIAWPYVQAKNWLQNDDNQTGMWITVIVTAFAALCVYGSLFFGGRAIVRAVSDDATITIVSGNPCLNEKGLIKAYAPAPCYADKLERKVQYPATTEERITAMTRNNDASVTPTNDNAYNPPCVKDGLPGCTDKIYSKRLVEGEIFTAEFNSDEKTVSDGHLQPDYTEVKFLALRDDEEAPSNEKFCGNVLDKFTPGKKFKMVINESKQSDYNGCYVIEVVQLTFGGDNYRPRRK